MQFIFIKRLFSGKYIWTRCMNEKILCLETSMNLLKYNLLLSYIDTCNAVLYVTI